MRLPSYLRPALLLLMVNGSALRLSAEESQPGPPTYARDVKAVLDAKCAGCHSRKNAADAGVSGGLAFDSFEAVLESGAVVSRDLKISEMVRRLRQADPELRMPREGPPLPESAIALIERWIAEGLPRGEASGGAPAAPASPLPRARARRPRDLAVATRLKAPPGWKLSDAGSPPPAAEVRLRVAPLSPVSALAFAPAGDLLAAGGDGTVTVWDLGKGEPVRALNSIAGTVHAIRYSADGRLLGLGGGPPGEPGLAVVLDATTWAVLHRFGGHRDAVLALAFSPDGSLLATGSFGKGLRVFDLKTGSEALTFNEHSDAVYGVQFLGGGKLLASAGADRAVKLADLELKKVVQSLSGHGAPVLALAASPDGKALVSSGVEPALRFWSAGESGWKSQRTAGGHDGRVEEVVFSRDGKLVASAGSDRTVRIWSTEGGKEIKRLTGASEWLYAVDFDAAAERVAAGGWDGTLRIWEVASGRLLAVLVQLGAQGEEDLDWAIAAPEGYFRASREVLETARFAFGGGKGAAAEMPARLLQRWLDSPARIAAALSAQAVPPASIEGLRAF